MMQLNVNFSIFGPDSVFRTAAKKQVQNDRGSDHESEGRSMKRTTRTGTESVKETDNYSDSGLKDK
jgi:hypothetical protein